MSYDKDCRCRECQIVHSQTIHYTGEWPKMGHEEGQVLKLERIALIQDWAVKAMRAGQLPSAKIP